VPILGLWGARQLAHVAGGCTTQRVQDDAGRDEEEPQGAPEDEKARTSGVHSGFRMQEAGLKPSEACRSPPSVRAFGFLIDGSLTYCFIDNI
jgi:hypothetical protein